LATAFTASAVVVAVPRTAHAAPATTACSWVGSTAPIEQRVAQVLSQMTLDEKITMVHGAAGSAYAGYIPGVARLCIPALKMQDGPVGVRMNDTTQLPAAVDPTPIRTLTFSPGRCDCSGIGTWQDSIPEKAYRKL
jgi:beta-glucosidase